VAQDSRRTPPLGPILARSRVVLCLGAGGVGKTTVSAAIAARLAAEGRRVLCLTIDPARRLADSLGLPPGHADEVEIPRERLAAAGLDPRGTLAFAQLDPARTFDAAVRRGTPDTAAAERVVRSRLYRHLAGTLPGMHEFMAMERFLAARADPWFDVVVHDTPPSANALDFLDAPRRLREALDSPFVSRLSARAGAGLAARAGGRGLRLALRLLTRFTGPGFFDDVATLLADARTALEAFHRSAAEVERALRAPDVAFLLVTSPRPESIDEVAFVHDRLAELRIPVAAFVVNRVRPAFDCSRRGAEDAARRIPLDLLLRLQASLAEQNGLADEDERQIARLVERCGPEHPCLRIPAFSSDVRDLPGVRRIADALFADGGVDNATASLL
jgi:anion-transporting  ArsA/GET3 family ATPase